LPKLPEERSENLLKPENKEQLVAILTYHVVPGKIMAADASTTDAKDSPTERSLPLR
jgi:uncharacterized surface protein with fasciclin (FAS1) repeats